MFMVDPLQVKSLESRYSIKLSPEELHAACYGELKFITLPTGDLKFLEVDEIPERYNFPYDLMPEY